MKPASNFTLTHSMKYLPKRVMHVLKRELYPVSRGVIFISCLMFQDSGHFGRNLSSGSHLSKSTPMDLSGKVATASSALVSAPDSVSTSDLNKRKGPDSCQKLSASTTRLRDDVNGKTHRYSRNEYNKSFRIFCRCTLILFECRSRHDVTSPVRGSSKSLSHNYVKAVRRKPNIKPASHFTERRSEIYVTPPQFIVPKVRQVNVSNKLSRLPLSCL